MAKRRTVGQLQSVAGFPEMMWLVEIYGHCPKCGGEVTLGSVQGGGTAFNCQGCGDHGVNKDVSSDDAVATILDRAKLRS